MIVDLELLKNVKDVENILKSREPLLKQINDVDQELIPSFVIKNI